MIEFEAFPKIARYSNNIIVTEKLDGTNAQIIITADGQIAAGSRSRLIAPGKTTDNYGFAAWVEMYKGEIIASLGEGRHYGEWWGAGIQRGYNVREKRFSLFNAKRWTAALLWEGLSTVPIVYEGPNFSDEVDAAMQFLRVNGSMAAPGFMDPEGVIVYHTASRTLYKKTFDHDKGKWSAAA